MGQITDEYGCPRKKHAGWLLSRSWEIDDVRVGDHVPLSGS